MNSQIESFKRLNVYIVAAWIMTGLLLVHAAFFTCLNGYHKLSFSAEDKNVYEVNNNMPFAFASDGETFVVCYDVFIKDSDVNCFKIDLKNVQSADATMRLEGVEITEEAGITPVYSADEISIADGLNTCEISETDYQHIRLTFTNAGSVRINRLWFSDEKGVPYSAKALLFSISAGLVYLLITVIVYLLVRRKWTPSLIMTIRSPFFEGPALPEKAASLTRTIVFFAILVFSLLIAMGCWGKRYIPFFREYLAAQLAMTLLLTLLMNDHKPQTDIVRVDKPAFIVCAFLAAYTFLSDILVDKPFRFSGISLFIVLFIMGCKWTSRQDSEVYIRDFERAVQGFLIVFVILSLLLNNSTLPDRFSGPLKNPSIYALYLGGIWAVLLGSMEHHLSGKSKRLERIITVIELVIVMVLLLKAQSMTPIIAVLFVSALWIFRLIARKKSLKLAVTVFVITGITGILILLGLVLMLRRTDAVPSIRLLAKLQSANISLLITGRDYIWRACLRKMNLFGHGRKIVLWGVKTNPHNALIGMAYMYGMPCVIPYIIMMVMAVEKSYRYADKDLSYSAVPLYSIVTFVIMSLADNVEQPLVWLPTIACYLLMAPMLVMPLGEKGES